MKAMHCFLGSLAATICFATPALAAPGYLGVYLTDDDRSSKGALVEDVAPRSPAQRAGLRRGDRIIQFNGQATPNAARLIPLLMKTETGQQVTIRASRKGWERTFRIRLSERNTVRTPDRPRRVAPPRIKERGFLGIYVRQGDKGEPIIDNVMTGSAAFTAGLKVDDVILLVNGKEVSDPSEVITQLSQFGAGDTVAMTVRRDGQTLVLRPKLTRKPTKVTPPTPDVKPTPIKPAPVPSKRRRPYIGVSLDDNDARGPLKVDEVRANSPAQKFGLRTKDVIISVDGKKLKTIEDFVNSLRGKFAGDSVSLKIERDGWRHDIRLTLGAAE